MPTPDPAPRPSIPGRFGPDHQPRGRAWTAEEIAQLGTAPDPAIAQALARTSTAVRLKRLELGIQAATGRGRPRLSAARLAPAPAAGSNKSAATSANRSAAKITKRD